MNRYSSSTLLEHYGVNRERCEVAFSKYHHDLDVRLRRLVFSLYCERGALSQVIQYFLGLEEKKVNYADENLVLAVRKILDANLGDFLKGFVVGYELYSEVSNYVGEGCKHKHPSGKLIELMEIYQAAYALVSMASSRRSIYNENLDDVLSHLSVDPNSSIQVWQVVKATGLDLLAERYSWEIKESQFREFLNEISVMMSRAVRDELRDQCYLDDKENGF